MSYSLAVNAMLRHKYLEEMYERMTDEEKKLFVLMILQNKSHSEVMQAIEQQRLQLNDIKKGQNWTRSFGSDILANFTSAGIIWLASKLFK